MNIRDEILSAIEKEIVGPLNNPHYLDDETQEEILLAKVHGPPKSRYGAGMLYPQQSINREESDSVDDSGVDEPSLEQRDMVTGKRSASLVGDENEEEEPVGLANQYLPSAIGFTVRFNSVTENDIITLHVESAYYEKGALKKGKKQTNQDGDIMISKDAKGDLIESEYWIRRPICHEPIRVSINSIFIDYQKSYEITIKNTPDDKKWLSLKIFNRTTARDNKEGFLTYTFVLINNLSAQTDDVINSNSILYQNKLILRTTNDSLIAPYKERNSVSDTDEEAELNLLYRKKRVFSIGHGTSVVWETKKGKETGREIVNEISSSTIPVYDLPQVAPTAHINLSMLELSDLGSWEKAKSSLKELEKEYKKWIESIDVEAETLAEYREAARKNVQKCKQSLDRIEKGIQILTESNVDSDVVKCFRWMNRAMLWQQQRSKTKIRRWIKTDKENRFKLDLEGINGKVENQCFPDLNSFHEESDYNGRWRPFQLAFVVMNIESIINPKSEERKIVDLIWFPTGGGKTEAYLGLTAFNIFHRRINISTDFNEELYGGTSVLMRYTLRLLTTQQYERAASLICACDLIRKDKISELGLEPISIGLWVGGDSTPNSIDKARAQFRDLRENVGAEYNFVVMKCPCCGTQIGKVSNVNKYDKEKIKGLFIEDGSKGRVVFKCENEYCEYYQDILPLQVIDELIYDTPPTLLLGTVDKFAMIPWKKEAGSLFGFRSVGSNWKRIIPPELIIQDELHLISGPLGTMVGLYETMVQSLCNNYKGEEPPFITKNNMDYIPPKIVASSATISRSYEQVQALYGIIEKSQLNIFPAQGLSFGDTWFSEEKSLDEYENGKQKYPGRRYVGILASGFPSAQTAIVRTYSAVLQVIKELSAREDVTSSEIDYYWSLLGYFNSIRELGGASSLVYGDIRERLGQIQSRDLITFNKRRNIYRIEELTSRISSSEIPSTLKKLETSFSQGKNQALDICLATNMVATGVDISRLGLMFIHGQPKTTAEYVQASSRVGRDTKIGPGLIFTLYSPSKPRDKSQYEQFQGYHSRIYSNVEPTSVTPFSVNVRERALHAILIGMIRHFSAGPLKEWPVITEEFEDLVEIVSEIITNRCRIVDPDELSNTVKLLNRRVLFWRKGFERYGDAANYRILKDEKHYPLMYSNSAEVREDIVINNRALATPTSMRGVDTESVLSVYSSNLENVE